MLSQSLQGNMLTHENLACSNTTATSFRKVKRTTEFCLSRWLHCFCFLKKQDGEYGREQDEGDDRPQIQKGSQLSTSFLADLLQIFRGCCSKSKRKEEYSYFPERNCSCYITCRREVETSLLVGCEEAVI